MADLHTYLKKELNKNQHEAVTTSHPATMVIAGAGSGKTRVITSRIAHLILNENVNPTSIIALTFTNKAAGEMKDRLSSFLGTDGPLPFIGTFHSYCLLLLRRNSHILPFPTFSILDTDDQLSLLKKIIKRNGLDKQVTASAMSHTISMAKNKLMIDSNEEVFAKPLFKEIYLAYEAEKSAAHSLDFDDLLVQTLTAFQNNTAFRESFQERIDHILVDEYQDTSFVQHSLLKNMALKKGNKKKKKPELAIASICGVGDQDQSIYSWRGAMVTNMLTFQQDFSPVTVIKIEQNYRSVQPILKAANNVISNNTDRHEKKLWSDKKASNRILITKCQSGYQEADVVINVLKQLERSKKKMHDVAVLYRTHFQSRALEEALLRNGIAYHIVGGIRFYERKEIKDILAYLRLIINPFDRTSLFRILNYPTRGLGAKFEEAVFHTWQQQPLFDFKQLLTHMLNDEQTPLRGLKAETVRKFLSFFNGIDENTAASYAVEKIIERTGYIDFLRKTLDPKQADTKQENVREFVQSIKHFEQTSKNDASLETFLHEIALMQEKMEKNNNRENQVLLMTLHAVKGLEFDTVIITGLEEGLLPSNRSLHSAAALEEERRLFYVGMTRAKERLILLHADYRNTYGSVTDQLVSRFVHEIPSRLFTHMDMSELTGAQSTKLFCSWLGIKPDTRGMVTFSTGARPVKRAAQKLRTFSKKLTPAPWKKNQPVIHEKFGAGVIKKVEKKADDYYLVVQFRSCEKKLHAKFVRSI